jgi:AGCS family alanine or glycine:cation symporter
MKVIHIALVFLGAAGGQLLGANSAQVLNNLWDMADTLNGLMAIPNLIGLLLLSGVLRKLVTEFDAKRKSGEIKL